MTSATVVQHSSRNTWRAKQISKWW